MTYDDAIRWLNDANKAHQACVGIDTASLWPGAMGEIATALRLACARLEAAGGTIPVDAPEILAKLGKA